jgi:hypothetical protein
VQEHAEPTGVIVPDAASDYHALQRNRLALTILQRQQAGPEPAGFVSREVADHQAVDPSRNGIGVVRVAVLGQEHGIHVHADAYFGPMLSAERAPEVVLAMRLAHYLKILGTFKKRRLQWPLAHPRRATLLVLRAEIISH